MTLIACLPLEAPAEPPSINIPQIGAITKARAAFDQLPDLGTYLVQFQDIVAAQMAPIIGYLELLEAVMATYKCMRAIPQAISSLSPKPVFDCLKNLQKAMLILLKRFPPLAWILTMLDVIDYVMSVMREALSFIVECNAKLARMKSSLTAARLRGNTDLELIIRCSVGDMQMQLRNMAPLMLMISPLIAPLMKILAEYMPDPRLTDADEVSTAMGEYFIDAFAALAAGDAIPALPSYLPTKQRLWAEAQSHLVKSAGDMEDWVSAYLPALGWLLISMVQSYNAGVTVYNFLAPLVGKSANKQEISVPETSFF